MDISRSRARAIAVILTCVVCLGGSVVGALRIPCAASEIVDHVTAVIVTDKESYPINRQFDVKVIVRNGWDRTVYILKENRAGLVWRDALRKRFVIAHYAFTGARQEKLWGGGTILESYRPEFYEVPPDQEHELRWTIAKEKEAGKWRLDCQISVQPDVTPFEGLEGTAALEAMAKSDTVISCLEKLITVEGN